MYAHIWGGCACILGKVFVQVTAQLPMAQLLIPSAQQICPHLRRSDWTLPTQKTRQGCAVPRAPPALMEQMSPQGMGYPEVLPPLPPLLLVAVVQRALFTLPLFARRPLLGHTRPEESRDPGWGIPPPPGGSRFLPSPSSPSSTVGKGSFCEGTV